MSNVVSDDPTFCRAAFLGTAQLGFVLTVFIGWFAPMRRQARSAQLPKWLDMVFTPLSNSPRAM